MTDKTTKEKKKDVVCCSVIRYPSEDMIRLTALVMSNPCEKTIVRVSTDTSCLFNYAKAENCSSLPHCSISPPITTCLQIKPKHLIFIIYNVHSSPPFVGHDIYGDEETTSEMLDGFLNCC